MHLSHSVFFFFSLFFVLLITSSLTIQFSSGSSSRAQKVDFIATITTKPIEASAIYGTKMPNISTSLKR